MKYEYIHINKGSFAERPKQKLLTKGSSSLSDYDLLSLIIGSTPSNLQTISSILLELINQNKELPCAKTIAKKTGLSLSKASTISAALEFGRRRSDPNLKLIGTPDDIYKSLMHYADADKEHFIVGTLNGAHALSSLHVVTIGILNRTLVHPREVFHIAISNKSAAIFIAHNHPSGNLEPSNDDLAITRRLVEASAIIGIPILDHLIFSSSGFLSFKREKILNF